MSLINEMLKDLVAQRKAVTPDNILFDLTSDISDEFKKNKRYYITTSIAILGLVTIFYGVYSSVSHSSFIKATAHSSVSISATPLASSMLTGIALQMQDDVTSMRFLLDQNPTYQMSSNADKHELTITLEHTQLLAELPTVNYAGSGVEAIKTVHDKNGNLNLILKLSPYTDIKRLELNKQGIAPELQLDLIYKRVSETPATVSSSSTLSLPVTIKTPVNESLAEREFHQAVDLSASGKESEAVELLKPLVDSQPNYTEARELLVSLLVKQSNLFDANKVIDEALALTSIQPVFAEDKAKMLVAQGNSSQALKILEQYAPPLVDNVEYHSFLAALYQQEGKPSLASSLYKQLIAIEPNNGKLWLGLGMAFEELGQSSQADEAYTNADKYGNLSPEVKAYIDSRLQVG
jgi:Flp pilus assembly protein TadD